MHALDQARNGGLAVSAGPADPAGRDRRCTTTRIAADRTSAKVARDFVGATLASWQVGEEELTQKVQLATSELVTNAVEHGAGDPLLALEVSRRTVTLCVRDEASQQPCKQPASRTAAGGRGLLIVEGLSSDWGHAADDAGKWVWAEFARSAR